MPPAFLTKNNADCFTPGAKAGLKKKERKGSGKKKENKTMLSVSFWKLIKYDCTPWKSGFCASLKYMQ